MERSGIELNCHYVGSEEKSATVLWDTFRSGERLPTVFCGIPSVVVSDHQPLKN